MYVSNGHKWLFSPKGSAVCWINDSVCSKTFPEPTVIGSENNCESNEMVPLETRFLYTGTRDYTSLLSMDAALTFRESLGGDEQIYKYVHGLLCESVSVKIP